MYHLFYNTVLLKKHHSFYEHQLLNLRKSIFLQHSQKSSLLYKFLLAVWKITFETPWGKIQNLLRIKLTIDVTLLCLSPINDIYLFFFMSQVETMELSQSINSACCFELVLGTHFVNKFQGKSNLCMK